MRKLVVMLLVTSTLVFALEKKDAPAGVFKTDIHRDIVLSGITTGHLFVYGHNIKPPYEVRENAKLLYVNGIMYPFMADNLFSEKEKFVMTFSEICRSLYYSFRLKGDQEEATQKLKEMLEAYPEVKHIVAGKDKFLITTSKYRDVAVFIRMPPVKIKTLNDSIPDLLRRELSYSTKGKPDQAAIEKAAANILKRVKEIESWAVKPEGDIEIKYKGVDEPLMINVNSVSELDRYNRAGDRDTINKNREKVKQILNDGKILVIGTFNTYEITDDDGKKYSKIKEILFSEGTHDEKKKELLKVVSAPLPDELLDNFNKFEW